MGVLLPRLKYTVSVERQDPGERPLPACPDVTLFDPSESCYRDACYSTVSAMSLPREDSGLVRRSGQRTRYLMRK